MDEVEPCAEMFIAKNTEYGDAITETGVLGAVVEAVAVVARLKQLVQKNPEHGRDCTEQVRDKFRDLQNYANIGLQMLAEENFDGE